MLLHGFGEDSSIWDLQKDFLKKICTVILPDLPGSGKSGLLKKENAGMEDYAACIQALLEHEHIDQCIMLGHSMGGYIVLAFVEMYPGKIKRFGFVNSTAFADSEEKNASRKQAIKMIEEHGAYSFLKNAVPVLFSTAFKNKNGSEISALVEKGRQFSNEALVQYNTAMLNRPDRVSVLKKTDVPVLFIIGTEDNAAPVSDLLQQVHLPATAQINILEGVGHMSMLEAPDKLNKHLQEFCE